jgi:trimeric autotransporter adhesin
MTIPGWAVVAALPLALASFAFAQQYVISTYAGGAPPPTPVAGTAASIGQPQGVATDAAGNVYFLSDDCVFKLDTNSILTRVVGTCRAGYSGDGGQANSAQLRASGVAVDGTGNLYIADSGNNRIRKVTSAGIITTVVGNGSQGYSGDGGPATSAQLNQPYGVAEDSTGNLYIADRTNTRIRKVTPAGIISTVAGDGSFGSSGDGGPATNARLYYPDGVAVDSTGNLYIADWGNNQIRKVTPAGIISTVAGNGSRGYSGDGGPATSAQLLQPLGGGGQRWSNLHCG